MIMEDVFKYMCLLSQEDPLISCIKDFVSMIPKVL